MDKTLSPIHPGEVLLEDFMKPLKLSQYCLARDIGVPPLRINQNVHGECSITAESNSLLTRRLQQDLAYDSNQQPLSNVPFNSLKFVYFPLVSKMGG